MTNYCLLLTAICPKYIPRNGPIIGAFLRKGCRHAIHHGPKLTRDNNREKKLYKEVINCCWG